MLRSLFILFLAFTFANVAAAADLGAAKASGQVCEQTNGYLRANAGSAGEMLCISRFMR